LGKERLRTGDGLEPEFGASSQRCRDPYA